MIGEVLEDPCHCFGGDRIASVLVESAPDALEIAVDDIGKKCTGYGIDGRIGVGKFFA